MKNRIEVVVESARIEPHFTIKSKNSSLPVMPFTQISDHYGASVKIMYNE